MTITPMMHTARWSLYRLTEDIAFIVDDDTGGMSVTNAAELVCADCFRAFGDRRIVYRDTSGDWDELVHDHGTFVRFKSWRGRP